MNEKICEHPDNLILIQSRVKTNHQLVEEYAEMMKEGIQFDPAKGVRDETGIIFVWDGFHRAAAARLANVSLLIEVEPGTKQDAEWLALSANQKHGLRRTKADEEWIARTALLKFPNRSVREIHRHTGINRRKISTIRDELVLSGAIAPDDKVTVTRGGTTYEQDTNNIGGTRPAYAPVWKLETAIRQWLGETFEDLAGQLQALAEIKDKTPEGQRYLNELLSDDSLPSPTRKRDVIQACHNVLDQLRPGPQSPRPGYATLESSVGGWTNEISEPKLNGNINIPTPAEPHREYKPQPQEFECPRCRQEKIVGVNGSRRWCLRCGAEWPTAGEFLAEVNANRGQAGSAPTRTELQQRFMQILAQLEEQDGRLIQIEIWLDELERQVVLSNNLHPATETVAPNLDLNSIPVLEYA
jgi:hypothetical protein